MDVRLIAFVNKGSGGNHGSRVLQLLKNNIGDENVFDIATDKGPDRGLSERASDPEISVTCLVAGGDGTFSWVANAVEKLNLSHVRLIIIPLGSGNDMSRAMGWGIKFPGTKKILAYLDYLNTAKPHLLDVWRLNAVEDPSLNSPPSDSKTPHGARPLICNYLSLGVDAFVELRFNQLRWENPEKYKSRLGNFRAHAMVGFKYMCAPKSKQIHIADHVQTLVVDEQPVPIPNNLQAIIFLNIPSYGAGLQPWGVVGSGRPADSDPTRVVEDMYVDDQKFEVIGLRNLGHFGRIKLFGAHGVRLAQGRTMKLTLKSESTPFQVDGEPWEQRGGTVSMEPGNKVGVMEGPYWKERAKSAMKFRNRESQKSARS